MLAHLVGVCSGGSCIYRALCRLCWALKDSGAISLPCQEKSPIGIFWGAVRGCGCLDLVEEALRKAGTDGRAGRRENLPAHLLGGGLGTAGGRTGQGR